MDIILVDNNPFQIISQVIDDQSYDFTIQYNKRDDSWFMEIGLTGEEPSVRTKLNVGGDLLAPFRYLTGVPDRYMLVVDIVKSFGRNDREGFVRRFIPVLLTEEEYNDLIV